MSHRQRRLSVPVNYAAGAGLYPGMLVALWMYDSKFVPSADTRGAWVYAFVERARRSLAADTSALDLLLIDPAS